ncbi:17745_t:CDS:1, partial [Dentiscutata erythropus]
SSSNRSRLKNNSNNDFTSASKFNEIIAEDILRHLVDFEILAENNKYIITELQRQIKNKSEVISRLNKQLEECYRTRKQVLLDMRSEKVKK